jgi:hypothetical protein
MKIGKETNSKIGIYEFHKFHNVSHYEYTHCQPSIDITIGVDSESSGDVYYIFDCPGGDAFAHWVYESFITYPIFCELRFKYPNIKVLTKNNKKYVKSFLKLLDEDIEIVNDIQNIQNICFFPPILSLNDHSIDQEFFSTLIDNFKKMLIDNVTIMETNGIILLPRNKKDNYSSNDRKVDIDDIYEYIIDNDGTIFNTYEINNLKLQFSIINSFKNIILDYGSSFLVNSIFQTNKNILVMDNFNHSYQIDKFIAMRILYDKICDFNNVNLLKNISLDDIKKITT